MDNFIELNLILRSYWKTFRFSITQGYFESKIQKNSKRLLDLLTRIFFCIKYWSNKFLFTETHKEEWQLKINVEKP